MNKKQMKVWNKLRFGQHSPTNIRRHFIRYFVNRVKRDGIWFYADNKCNHDIMIPVQNKYWDIAKNDPEDWAKMNFKYNGHMDTWFPVADSKCDIQLIIGWDNEAAMPFMMIQNAYQGLDEFIVHYKNLDLKVEQVAEHFAETFEEVLDCYISKHKRTCWLNKYQKEFFE